MNANIIYVIILATGLFTFSESFAQEKITIQKNLSAEQEKALKSLPVQEYLSFKAAIKPLIDEMGFKKVVGLGEGTHGTAEFYKVRYWITRILIEEKGFNHVAFENDFTEMWALNEQLEKGNDLNLLMQKYMIAIWQNEQTKELLQWIKVYNGDHGNKVTVSGIDYPVQKPDIAMLSALLSKANVTSLDAALANLSLAATLQDEAWFGMNKKGSQVSLSSLRPVIKKAYVTADSVERVLKSMEFEPTIKSNLLLAIGNLKQGFEPFYRSTPARARDSIMAYNTALLIPLANDKIVIWAHNAHLGKVPIYNGAVGGTGGYILKLFPNNYFALGTGTANGTFGGTTDARAVNTSKISSYKLENPIDGSWEKLFASASLDNFYFSTQELNPDKTVKPLRFIGFGSKSGATTYDKTNLNDLFDAFIFMKTTSSPTSLK